MFFDPDLHRQEDLVKDASLPSLFGARMSFSPFLGLFRHDPSSVTRTRSPSVVGTCTWATLAPFRRDVADDSGPRGL